MARGSKGKTWTWKRRKCNCEEFGCVTCMQRALSNHYQRKNRAAGRKRGLSKLPKYGWDRT